MLTGVANMIVIGLFCNWELMMMNNLLNYGGSRMTEAMVPQGHSGLDDSKDLFIRRAQRIKAILTSAFEERFPR